MFDYLAGVDDPRPALVAGAVEPAHGVLTALVPFSTSIVVEVPADQDALRARHRRRYWAHLRRSERRFAERHGPLGFAVLTDPEQVRRWLPDVRALFAQRWLEEFTSLPWKDEAGFRRYAEVLLDRAAQGRAALVVLEGDGRLLSFAYCLIEDDWCYFFQHAATTDPAYRVYSPGKLLLVRLLSHLVDDGRVRHLDLMLGDTGYKREWESWRRPVCLRIEEPCTPAGVVRLGGRVAVQAARVHVQFHSPRLRRLAKHALHQRELARTHRAEAPAGTAVLRVAG